MKDMTNKEIKLTFNRCLAKTKSGKRCKNTKVKKKNLILFFCWKHRKNGQLYYLGKNAK